MDQNLKSNTESKTPPKNQVIQNIEWFALDIINASTHLIIETLENGQQILLQLEKLGKTSAELSRKAEQFNQELRQTSRAFAADLNEDAVETLQEMVKGVGQVAQTTLQEIKELGKLSEDLGLNLFSSVSKWSQPFRKETGKRPKGKEPTIIPITIQDN